MSVCGDVLHLTKHLGLALADISDRSSPYYIKPIVSTSAVDNIGSISSVDAQETNLFFYSGAKGARAYTFNELQNKFEILSRINLSGARSISPSPDYGYVAVTEGNTVSIWKTEGFLGIPSKISELSIGGVKTLLGTSWIQTTISALADGNRFVSLNVTDKSKPRVLLGPVDLPTSTSPYQDLRVFKSWTVATTYRNPDDASFVGINMLSNSGLGSASVSRSGSAGGQALAFDVEGYIYTSRVQTWNVYDPRYFPKPVDCVLTARSSTENAYCAEITVDQGTGRPTQKLKFEVVVGLRPLGAPSACDGILQVEFYLTIVQGCPPILNCLEVKCIGLSTSQCQKCSPGFFLDQTLSSDRCLGM